MKTRPIHGAPVDSTPLQTRFNQRAFLAGRAMLPDAYPTLDVSLEWPLPYQIKTVMTTLSAASIETIPLLAPIAGVHGFVLRATANLSVSGAGDEYRLILRKSVPPVPSPIAVDDLTLAVYQGDHGTYIPIVGTIAANESATGTLPQINGARPVYVPSGFSAVLLATSAVGIAFNVNWLTVEFPDTQPLSSLLAGF